MYHLHLLLSLFLGTFPDFADSSTVFQGECKDESVLCEQLCLTISPETYECGCWNDHTLLDDGLSCRLNATKSTARDRPTELQTEPTTVTTLQPHAENEIVQLLPIDKDPPLRFNGRSFAEFPVDESFYLESNVTIEFKVSSQQDGLMLFAGEFTGDDFFSIVFQEPNIILRFDCGEGAIEDLYRGPFKSDQWHILTIHRRFCEYADMKADMSSRMIDRTEQFKYYKGISVDRGIFLGGAPREIDFLEGRTGAENGLDGCVRRVEINGKLLLDTRNGVNLAVNREKLDYCGMEPVATHLTPLEMDENTLETTTRVEKRPTEPLPLPEKGFKIREIVLKTGPLHSDPPTLKANTRPSAKLVQNIPTKTKKSYPERIVPIENVVLGPKPGTESANVTKAKPPRIVEFSGESHVTLIVPEDIEDYLEIVLYFKPSTNQGVIFAWSDAERYIVLTLEDGFANVHASMGVDAITLRSESIISLHSWHKVEVWRSGKGILLKIDHQSWIESELHSVRAIEKTGKKGMATIGNSNEATPAHLHSIPGFHGCIKRVVLNGHHMHLGALSSVGIRECGSDPCASSGCPSGCSARHDAFICLCQWPTYGKTCAQKTENSIEAMNFASHSYLEFNSDDVMQHITGEKLRLVLEFKLSNATNEYSEGNQILVFAGSEEESGDFLKLSVTRERKVRFEINLGSGIAELIHSTTVPFNKWTMVQVFREKRTLRLSVDGDSPVSTITPGTSEQLNVYKGFYIGGYESDTIHAEGLNGCVRMAELGTRLIRQPSDASVAINIKDCPL